MQEKKDQCPPPPEALGGVATEALERTRTMARKKGPSAAKEKTEAKNKRSKTKEDKAKVWVAKKATGEGHKKNDNPTGAQK